MCVVGQIVTEEIELSKSTAARVLGTLFLAILVGILGLVAWGFYLHWDLKRWDARIDALCAANGGKDVETRIYETATAPLTKEYFSTLDPPTSFFIPERSKGRDLGPKYPFVYETRVAQVLNDRNPSVVKYTEQIVRASDGKVLGERNGFQRAGGGLPGPDPGEIRNCPDGRDQERLEVLVFVNHPQHRKTK